MLAEHDITPYRLSKESGVAMNTVYAIVKDETKRIDKATLYAILVALQNLTNRTYEVSDIVVFEPKG